MGEATPEEITEWKGAEMKPTPEPRATPNALESESTAEGALAEAFKKGWAAGMAPFVGFDANPYRGNQRKKQSAWFQGWMRGATVYLDRLVKAQNSDSQIKQKKERARK